MGKRFYLFEMVDLWMNVFDSPGARTTGGKAREVPDHRTRLEGHRARRA